MKNKSYLKKIKPVTLGSAMADMALLLLIFFMAATTAEPPRGEEVDLPHANTQAAEQEGLFITIGQSGRIYFNGDAVSLEQLRNAIGMRPDDKDKTVSITADKNLNYREVALVLDLLRDLDFLNVVFMSQPREEDTDGP